ncbi:MAG: hypothetical protein ABIL22_00010 [candidate division WOR-3 bacterium]
MNLLFFIFAQSSGMTLAILPFGNVSKAIIDSTVSGISSLYDVEITVLECVPLPVNEYYKPNKRYRAEKILYYLESNVDTKYAKVLGLTTKDISTTKEQYHDWGIFGLGTLNGRVCVISTYRLRRKKASDSLFYARLKKVVNHELGHVFGLEHCPNDRCLMEDACGKIKTVDEETGALCPECASKVRNFLKQR